MEKGIIVKEISSSQNDQFKYWKTLLRSKGLREAKHFLLSGKKLVQEVLNDETWVNKISVILVENTSSDKTENINIFTYQNENNQNEKINLHLKIDISSKIIHLSSVLFKELDVLGTNGPILVMQQPEIGSWDATVAAKGLEILCPLGDPQNLGAVIRTSYAFGVSSVVLLKEAAHPFLPKSIKASSGAVLKIPLKQGPSIDRLKGKSIIALDLNGVELNSKKWPVHSMRLLLGEEGKGVPESFEGERMTLPMVNPMESLNAAVAAGIVIYQLSERAKNK